MYNDLEDAEDREEIEDILDEYEEKNKDIVYNDSIYQWVIGSRLSNLPIDVDRLIDILDGLDDIIHSMFGINMIMLIFGKMKNLYRTTTNRVFNNAELQAAYESGYTHKEWSAILDERTRPEHADLDGTMIPIEEDFEIDGYSAEAPGEFGEPEMDCNCRCSLIFHKINDEDML